MSGVFTRIVLPIAGLLLGAFAVAVAIDRVQFLEQTAERRALTERAAALDRAAIAPGASLACLDAGAGDAVENACERAVFASAQSAAAAVTYMAARLRLIADAAAFPDDADLKAALAASRRAVEIDRYGVVAQALAARDEGCTAERCALFALLSDTNALKANLKARVFEQYVSRYADAWNRPPGEKAPAVSALPAPVPPALAQDEPPRAPGKTVSSKYDFPSAASIPPVSIMNAEPPLPPAAAPAQGDPNPTAANPPAKRPGEAAPAPAR